MNFLTPALMEKRTKAGAGKELHERRKRLHEQLRVKLDRMLRLFPAHWYAEGLCMCLRIQWSRMREVYDENRVLLRAAS